MAEQGDKSDNFIQNENPTEETKMEEAAETLRLHYQEKLDISNEELMKSKLEVQTLKMSISAIGNQRDFFYSKLRDIEVLVTKHPNTEKEELMKVIKSILFAESEVELVADETGINVKAL